MSCGRLSRAHEALVGRFEAARKGLNGVFVQPLSITNVYRNASIVSHNRVVFNIRGNRYRLVVAVNYTAGIIYIRFIGTHQEYDKIDVTTI